MVHGHLPEFESSHELEKRLGCSTVELGKLEENGSITIWHGFGERQSTGCGEDDEVREREREVSYMRLAKVHLKIGDFTLSGSSHVTNRWQGQKRVGVCGWGWVRSVLECIGVER